MTQRSAIRGADIVGDPNQYAGAINAEKCIKYLRGIGVDIDDSTADEWLDTQAVSRFLKGMTRARLSFYSVHCFCGTLSGVHIRRRGRKPKTYKADETAKQDSSLYCEACCTFVGQGLTKLDYVVCVDGSERDYRLGAERITPFPWKELVGED